MSYKTITRMEAGASVAGVGSYFSGLAVGSGALTTRPAVTGPGTYTVPGSVPAGTGALVSRSVLPGFGSYVAPVIGGTVLTTLELTTTQVTGTYPFMVGLGFIKGEVPSSTSINLSGCVGYQVTAKRTWNDGSLKHAIVAGRSALTQNVAKTLTVSTGTAPTGTNLTSASITAANPQGSIQCGAIGTINLSSLFASPLRTWISGPEMVECHYRSPIGADTSLVAFFHVRLYADSRVWIRCIVENGYLDNGAGGVFTNSNKSYVPNLMVGGSPVYNNGGATLTHYANTRIMAEGWIGGDPVITPKHNVTHLRATKLVPNYVTEAPSAGALANLYQTYAVNFNGNIEAMMGGTGWQWQIGFLPLADAMYAATGHPTAYKSMLANASMHNNYGVLRRAKTTGLFPKPSDFPTWTYEGPGGTGTDRYYSGPGASFEWDKNHQGCLGYLAYLCTGDYWYYETLLAQCVAIYLGCSSGHGSGIGRIVFTTERGVGWSTRTYGLLSAIFPTGDAVAADYQSLCLSQAWYWKSYADHPNINGLGWLFVNELTTEAGGAASVYYQSFWVGSHGLLSDMDPHSDSNMITVWNPVRDWMYKIPVGLLGQDRYTMAGRSRVGVSNTSTWAWEVWLKQPFGGFYDTWDQVDLATFGVAVPSTNNTLQTQSGNDPATSAQNPWGNLRMMISPAVDHGAPGAADGWGRLLGATNAAQWLESPNFPHKDFPNFAIAPRNYSAAVQVPFYAQGLALNQIVEVPNSSIASIQAADWFHPSIVGNGPNNIIDAWNGACMDPRNGDIYIMLAGGHGDFGGNPVLKFTAATGRWSIIKASSVGVPPVRQEAIFYDDGTPSPSHNDYGTQFCVARNSILRVGVRASFGVSGGVGGSFLTSFNINSLAYGQLAPMPVGQFVWAPDLPVCTDPNTGNVYVVFQQKIYKWTESSNAWSIAAPAVPNTSQGVICVDSRRNRLYFTGDGGGVLPFVMDLTTNVVTTGLPNTLTGGFGWAVVFQQHSDPAQDVFIGRNNFYDGQGFFCLNAATLNWGASITATGATIPSGIRYIYNRLLNMPAWNLTFFVPTYGGNVFCMRTA